MGSEWTFWTPTDRVYQEMCTLTPFSCRVYVALLPHQVQGVGTGLIAETVNRHDGRIIGLIFEEAGMLVLAFDALPARHGSTATLATVSKWRG